MENNKIQINGLEIEYIAIGDIEKPIIMFAHGLGCNINQWVEQIKFFKNDYYIISFSLQGHGDSFNSNNSDDYNIDAYTNTVIELLEYLDIKSCIWVGNSMGGVIGYNVLKNHGIITHLITNGTTPKLKFNSFSLKLVEIMDKVIMKLFGFENYIKFAVKETVADKDVQDKLYEQMIKTSPFVVIQSHQILGNYDYLDLINETSIPISIIRTPNDRDINKSLNKFNDIIKTNDNIKIFDSPIAGHIFNMENPNEYNEVLESIIIGR